MGHPSERLDDTVHQRARLGILAVLTESGRAEFSFLRDSLALSDGNLSRHLQVLEEAGLVKIDKEFEGRRPRTWVSATAKGRAGLERELKALRELMDKVNGAGR